MTVKDYVDLFKKPAYLFKNNFIKKWMYFIPLCDYDEVVKDSGFKESEYGIIRKDGKDIVKIRDLIKKPFLTGDPNILIIPIYFNEEPEEKLIK